MLDKEVKWEKQQKKYTNLRRKKNENKWKMKTKREEVKSNRKK